MKTEITETGWKEITVKNIHIKDDFKNFLQDQTVEGWIKSNKRLKLYEKYRKVCGCCHVNWEKLSGNIHLLQTNVVNKVVCDSCYEKLKPILNKICH